MLKIPKINYYYAVLGAVFIYLIFPHRFSCIYLDYLRKYEIYDNLVQKTTKNVSISNKGLGVKCEYQELLEENLFLYKKPYTEEVINTNSIRLGGEYMPGKLLYYRFIIQKIRTRSNQFPIFCRRLCREFQYGNYNSIQTERESTQPVSDLHGTLQYLLWFSLITRVD